jgi:ELWxxDGT repeat protein
MRVRFMALLLGLLAAPAFGREPTAFASLGDRLFFTTNETDIPLWETDGTEPGTFRIRNLLPGSVGSWELVSAGSRVFFQAFDPATGRELWAIADD